MKKILFYIFIMLSGFQFNSVNAQIQLGLDIDGESSADQSGYSVSMPDAHTIAIGAIHNDGSGVDAGHVRIYTWTGSIWTKKGLDIDGEASGDWSGYSVCMPDANTVAIGAPSNDGSGVDAGHVRIYTWNGSVWSQKGADIDGETFYDDLGFSVSMADANTIAIGAPYNDGGGTDAGHVRVYQWNGSAWIQKGLDIEGEAAGDNSGRSVFMLDANILAIGAIGNDTNGTNNAGHVRIYEWNGSTWAKKGSDIDGEAFGDNSGISVSMPDANTLAIGAPSNDGSGGEAGHVRVYTWNGSEWAQKGADIDGEAANDYSGLSVSMPDANTLAIGAFGNGGSGTWAGHARVYGWTGSTWTQRGLDIDGEAANDYSGYSVSMPDANTVAIGAYNNNGSGGSSSGHVRVYKLKGIGGNVYNDINENCTHETEPGLNKRKAIIQPGDIAVETTMSGYWHLDSLPAGSYTITIDTTGKWRPTCQVTQNFTVTDPGGFTQAPSFGFVSTEPCSEPNVSINMPFMRPGFSGQKVYVKACNEYIATGALINGYVDVTLDELITVDAASMSYTALGDNTFRFDVGTLNPSQCVSFDMSTTVSTSAVLGQTLCVEANLFPVESCVLDTIPTPTPPDFTPCTLPWDNSSILVEGECVDGEIIFTITNTGDPGDGDMDCFSPVRLYIDGEYIWLDSLKLNGSETFTYTFAGDGRTWRLEVDQHPLHPGNSHPNATVEFCGDPTNWTPDLVNTLPQDDEDPIKDIYCGVVTGSYDPNDKTGYPLGVGEDHLIEPNRKMEYVIRFQNTGTDTAFTVKVLDTLDTDLDIFSVRSGVSSHNYHFRMHGPRVLEWTFYNIELPDSTTNEPASNGFVTFTAKQNKDLADGTEINNRVGIYFDFNDPIITNTTSHIIGRSIKTLPPLSTEDVSTTLDITRIYPNPNTGNFTVAFGQQLTNATITIQDVLGKTVYTTTVSGDKHNIQLNEAKGIYFVNIQTEQGERTTLKLVVE